MKNLKLLTLGIAVLAVACDPYSKTPGGAAKVAVVTATSGSRDNSGVAVDATASGTDYTVAAHASCKDGVGPVVDQSLTFVWLDKQIDGATVQTSVSNCTPVNGWLTATPDAPSGRSWYSCYYPSSPAPELGGAIVVFQARSGGVAGFDVAVPLASDNTRPVSYKFTGQLLTDAGVSSVTLNAPANQDPGTVNEGEALNPVVTDTTVTLSWTAPSCADGGTTYRIERADNVPGRDGAVDKAGPYTVLDEGHAALTYADTGRSPATKYWYKLTAVSSYTVKGKATVLPVTTRAPGDVSAVTFSAVAATSVTVDWAVYAGGTGLTYRVERAPNVVGTDGAADHAGTYANLATGLTALTYTDATVATGTKYWYRVRAVPATAGTTVYTPVAASVTTP